MTNMFTNNSNPSGYDTRYCGSYRVSDNFEVQKEYNSIKSEIDSTLNTEISTSNIEIDDKIEINNKEKKSEQIYQPDEYVEPDCDSISALKINYIISVIIRKLQILHRITKNRVLKKKTPDSMLIEREIEKRSTLNIVDMLTLLKIVNKGNSMSTQQRVVLLSEINKKAKLSVDEKIIIVHRLIAMDIIEDIPSKKHMTNKLTLLFIVKESGFSIDVTKTKGYKPVMQSVEEPPLTADNDNDNTVQLEQELKTELEQIEEDSDTTEESGDVSDITVANQAVDDSSINSKAIEGTNKKQVSKKPSVTQMFVNSKRHFKFGAGYIAKNDTLSLLLPSGYILDNNNRVYQSNSLRSDNKHTEKYLYSVQSPLLITITKNEKSSDYSLFDFFNSNINECKNNSLKYRQTVISKLPAVLKHKAGNNIYTASIFIKDICCVYDIQFKFKKTVANTTSTVNRILASIKFEGM